jgi:hypothetical protein
MPNDTRNPPQRRSGGGRAVASNRSHAKTAVVNERSRTMRAFRRQQTPCAGSLDHCKEGGHRSSSREYPELKPEDIRQALEYASALTNEEIGFFKSPAA